MALCLAISAALSGCVAQQADLKQAEKDFQKKSKQITDDLAQTRARQSEEITTLRDRELPGLRGEIERATHHSKELERRQDDLAAKLDQQAGSLKQSQAKRDARDAENEKRIGWIEKTLVDQDASSKTELGRVATRMDEVAARLDAVQKTMSALTQKIDVRLDDQQKSIHAGDAKSAAFARDEEARNRAVNEQLTKFNHALTEFKQALGGLGEKLVQQDQSAKQLSASLDHQAATVTKRTDALAMKVDADTKAATTHVNEINKAMTEHLNEVNKSVASVARALETTGTKVMGRVDEQDRRLDEIAKAVDDIGKYLVQQREAPRSNQQQGRRSASHPGENGSDEMSARHGAELAATTASSETPMQMASIAPRAESSVAGGLSDKDIYDEVLKKYKEGDLEAARQGFAVFLAEHPKSELAPNARFWMGEAYYGKKDFKRAIDAYELVQQDYPNSEKVPSALLKKGYAYLALKDRKRASSSFRQVIDLYPKTPEAGRALDKLTQLKDSH
ncbi:MAG: tol-pal system protein YbgF [Nitrospiraceae bacterium]